MTKHKFSAGKSLAQKFGVKYIETSPGIIQTILCSRSDCKKERKMKALAKWLPATWHNGTMAQ